MNSQLLGISYLLTTAGILIGLRLRVQAAESRLKIIQDKTQHLLEDLRKIETLKNEFISTVSHELRTPLTAIGGFAKLMSVGDAGPVNPTQAEFLKIIETNVDRLAHLINDILDVEKIEAGSFQVRKDEVDLVDVLKESVESIKVLANKKGLELQLELNSKNLIVLGDRHRLAQIITNLLSNAIKYTQKGHVKVIVEEYERAVFVKISDTGIGISSADQEKIFQKFFRTEASQALSEPGTGLGLTIVKSLVEAHQGSINVESKLGQGTTFTLILPLVRREWVDESDRDLFLKLNEKTVWLIEPSDIDSVKTQKLLFEAASHYAAVLSDVIQLRNLTDALIELQNPEHRPALIIFDPSLEADPLDAVSRLRGAAGKNIPILVTSRKAIARGVFEKGANSFLEKPIEIRALIHNLRDVFHQMGSKVLLVESNTDLRLLLKRGLEKRGFEVDDVDHGRLVFERLKNQTYNLVIIDEDLTDISARELGKEIREDSAYQKILLCIATHQDAREVNPYDFSISKSRSIEETVDELSRRLGRVKA